MKEVCGRERYFVLFPISSGTSQLESAVPFMSPAVEKDTKNKFLRNICTTERSKENESIRQQRLGVLESILLLLLVFGKTVARPREKLSSYHGVCVCVPCSSKSVSSRCGAALRRLSQTEKSGACAWVWNTHPEDKRSHYLVCVVESNESSLVWSKTKNARLKRKIHSRAIIIFFIFYQN